jgi:hypothetical protein
LRWSGHPEPTSTITTRVNSLFPQPDFHRQDMPPCGLQTQETQENTLVCILARDLPVLTVLVLLWKQANSPNLTGTYERNLPDGWQTN